MVRTAPAAASSSSAAADGVGDNRGGSGASGVDKSGSAEAIAAAVLVLMDPPMKQLTRAEEAAQRGAISFLHHQMGSPGKTSNTAPVQEITTCLDLPKGAGTQAIRRTLVRKRKRKEHKKEDSSSSSSSSGDCIVPQPRRPGKPKVGLASAKMFAHAVRMGMGQRQLAYAVNAMLKNNAKATATRHQKGAPEKSPEFVPHPNCAAAVANRYEVWARWLAQQS